MRPALFIAAVVVGLIVAVLVLVGGQRQTLRSVRDARALASLPLEPVAPLLQPDGIKPDLVVFLDGDDGWFEVAPDTLPPDLEIGFHGPRFFDMLTGNTHLPIYCGGNAWEGKIIWIVVSGEIADDYAFCNPNRMDLAPLRPFAQAVEMVSADLTRAEVTDLQAQIAADPDLAAVALSRAMSDLTHRRVVTTPLAWFAPDSGTTRLDLETRVAAAIRAELGQAEVFFARRAASNPNMTLYFDEPGGAQRQVTGMAVRVDGQVGVLEGFWGEPYEIRVDCFPAACARLDDMDFTPLLAPGRDIEGLRAALPDLVFRPTAEGPTPDEWVPTQEDLENPALTIGGTRPVTYLTRHIIRHPDATE